MSARRPRVVVIGGGLTGLATAWHLRDHAEVVVHEADSRAGGQIHSVELDDVTIDVGADAMLTRQPEGQALVRALGLGDELVAPSTGRVAAWVQGRLRVLPAGTVLGVPTELRALASSGVLTPAGLARAALEPLLPRRQVAGDRTLADLIGERFGPQVVDRLVEPLLSGVYAGVADTLGTQASAPPVWAAAREHRSLLVGLRRQRREASSASDGKPVFLTVRGGLGRVVDRLLVDLADHCRTGSRVQAVEHDGRQWTVTTPDGSEPADHVVLAVPAAVAARLLARHAPDAAVELGSVRTASVAVVALAYEGPAESQAPRLSGILVPRSEGRLVKAVTLSSRKWPHLADRDRFLVRASVGRDRDDAALALDDDVLAERVDAEVRWATGIRAPAPTRHVRRWPDALPQYEVGHLGRVERIREAVRRAPVGLHLGGAALDGVGLAARAREAAALAAAIRSTARASD